VSSPEPTRIDVQERGANQQTSDRRLYMQLQVFGGCLDPKPPVGALESRRIEAALYQDVNDPRGIGVLAMSEDPAFFVNGLRELFNADPFATLALKPEFSMFGRTYSSGFETDLEDWLLRRPRRAVLNPAWPWGIWYPLRRTGGFARLSGKEQGEVIREHSVLGRAYGDADLAHDIPPRASHAEDGPDLAVHPDTGPVLRRPRPLAEPAGRPRRALASRHIARDPVQIPNRSSSAGVCGVRGDDIV